MADARTGDVGSTVAPLNVVYWYGVW